MSLEYLPAIVSIFAYFVASFNALRRTFMPAPVPRAIWAVVSFISLTSLFATSPDGVSRYLAIGLFVGAVILLLFSLDFRRVRITRANVITVIGIAICLALWYVTDNPFVALVAILATDAIGILLNTAKIWRNPYFEDMTFWALLAVASLFGMTLLFNGGGFTVSSLLFVTYFFASQLFTFTVILIRLVIIEKFYPPGKARQLRLASSR